MKASEIKEAALKAQALCCNGDTCRQCQAEIEKFEEGALWMQTQLRNQIKIAMGALWDEDEIAGSLWLGSTAICLIKAALEIEPEIDESIPFDGDGEL